MSVKLRRDRCCIGQVEGDWGDLHPCLRPARELGGYCTACWRGLSPERRDVLRWEAGIEPVVVSRVDLLTPAEYRAREGARAAREALIASETASGLAALEAWLRDAA
jgi:hypothetical protein